MGLTPQEALDLFNSDDLIGIGMAANEVRRKKTDPRIATYQIDRNINYTNFCTEYCSFCAFYRPLGSKEGYIQPLEVIYEKIEEMIKLGGTGVLLQGGLHPDLKIEWYEHLLRSVHERFPQVHLHCFSAPEILCIAEVSGLSIRDTIIRLRDAGLQSIPGGGAEILDDEVRHRGMGIGPSRGAQARHAHHRDDDVWLWRRISPPREPPRAAPPYARRQWRLHGIHPVDFRARKYFTRKESFRDHGVRLPENAGDQPALSR
jgi:2-iminoacetate synthase ThiH